MTVCCVLVNENVDRPESTDQSWDMNCPYGSHPIHF